MLNPGSDAIVRSVGFMPEFICELSGRYVQVVNFAKWAQDCDAGVWPGLSHYHVIVTPIVRSPSGLVHRFCVPAAYLETRTTA